MKSKKYKGVAKMMVLKPLYSMKVQKNKKKYTRYQKHRKLDV